MSTTTSYTQPVLVGGLVMGTLSALPLVQAGNCCCLWLIGGGMVAAYLLQQNRADPITPGDGALVGLLAGLAGAVVWLVLSIPIDLLTAPMNRAMAEWAREAAGPMPPEVAAWLDRMNEPGEFGAVAFAVGKVFGFMFTLFFGAIFSTVGGLLGAAVFRRSAPRGPMHPPGTPGIIDVPPS